MAPWPAPAKLNLFLHIVGRRANGYHLLQTVFQFIDLCDELEIAPRQDGVIRALHALPGISPEQDLTMRAARLLKQAAAVREPSFSGADIRLRKRLPLGGGLGGGSSDAATTLVALNHLWDLKLSIDELAALGLRLGADVPVFVRGLAAWGEGVGERLTPLSLSEPWYLVLVPPCHVSTAEVFRDPELTRDSPPITISGFHTGSIRDDWVRDDGVRNDCEAVVRGHYPEVDSAMRWLGRYAQARLTGTGACVFAAFDDEAEAQRVCAQAPAGWQVLVARGLNRSPLLARLAGA